MQNPRDPSLLRSLAVAFGDGLAFGVGMKLSQNAARRTIAPAAAPARLAPASDRLEHLEARLARLEETAQAAPAGSGFDRKVMEAVVNALDARLKEHAGQVERRLTELEARFTLELQALHEQGRNATAAAGARADECEAGYRASVAALREEFRQEIEALRREQTGPDAVAKLVEAGVASRVEAAVESRLRPVEDELVEQVREASERTAFTAAAAARAAADECMAPLREELAERNREIAELGRRIEESGRASAGFLAAIGNACLQAAQSLTPSGPAQDSQAGPERNSEARAETTPDPEPLMAPPPLQADAEAAPPDDAAAPDPEFAPPGFEELKGAGRIWRVPMVSCFLAGGGLTLLRFL